MRFTILIFTYSALLIIYGVVNIIFFDKVAVEILSPIIFGGIILIMGIMSSNKDLVLFGQHGAAALSLIAFITSVSGFMNIFSEDHGSFYSNLSDIYLTIISLIFLVLAVRQFANDRKETPSG